MENENHIAKKSFLKRLWIGIEILNVRLRFIFLMILVGLIAGHWDSIMNHYDRWTRPKEIPQTAGVQETEFYCPMHPNIIRGKPGNCPICGMPLVKRAKTTRIQLPEGVLAQVQLTPLKMEMGRIGASPIEYRLLSREIRTVGIIDYDETRMAFIASRVKGRIDKLLVNYVGQRINKGDPLTSIYSPDLVVAQEELLTTIRSLQQQKQPSELLRSETEFLKQAAIKKLLLLGITEKQVEEIIRRNTPETHLTIYSPIAGIVTEKNVLVGQYVEEGMRLFTIADLGTVWMQAKIYEDQIAGIKPGTIVEITSTAYPNEVFAGRITFIAYTVDPATRTVSARVEIDNPDYKLKPGMYSTATVRLPVGQVTEHKEKPNTGTPVDEKEVKVLGLIKAYLTIASAFARDISDTAVIGQFIAGTKALARQTEGDFRSQLLTLAGLAEKLQGKDLQEQRNIFKALSENMIKFLQAYAPGQANVYIAYCPMADASWLTETKTILNPYYGKQMLTCGEITGRISPKPAQTAENFVTGYFCPIYPDRIFAKPEQCPIDKFPFKFVRVEKVLAVPESAVIDTGIRKVVYRESLPGTFDMIEVKTGPRTGEFFPVISGLKSGDRVATMGAFLVDAENRLNPAAAVQYFGASGGPKTEHKH